MNKLSSSQKVNVTVKNNVDKPMCHLTALKTALIKKMSAFVLGICLSLSLSMPVMADDTEIYLSTAATTPEIQPNVLFLLDTSGSMGNKASNAVAYDATKNYADITKFPSTHNPCFDGGTIYRLINGNVRNKAIQHCDSGFNRILGRVLFEKFFCDNANLVEEIGNSGVYRELADSTGFYTDKIGRYVRGSGGDTQRWKQINRTSNQVVECKGDRKVHGFAAGNAAVYASNIGRLNGNARWTSNVKDEFPWNTLATKTLYTGNYLNYLLVTKPVSSFRIEIIRDAMINFINSTSGINLGFMPYSQKLENNRAKGGMVEVAVGDINTTKADIIERLNVYGTRHDTSKLNFRTGHFNLVVGTPSARQYYEALRYFKGESPVYGVDSKAPPLGSSIVDNTAKSPLVSFPSVPASRKGGVANASYQSPAVNECQKNYVILLTDGLPFADSIKPEQLTEMGITDTSCTVDSSCVTGRCDNTCLPLFAKAGALLNKNDVLNEIQPISTFTIGFGLDSGTPQGQRAIRALNDSSKISRELTGKGQSFLANNADELRAHLTTIIEALDVPSTFSAPAVSVNAFNRTVHLDDLFFTLFVPGDGPHWDGNLKKYKLKVKPDVNDINGNGDKNEIIPFIEDAIPTGAIDLAKGFFKATSKSFWSKEVDGVNVALGGAVEDISSRIDRNVYTYTGSYTTVGGVQVPSNTIIITGDNKVAASNKAKVTAALLGIDGATIVKDGLGNNVLLHEALLDWATGLDVLDQAGNIDDKGKRIGNGDITDARGVMGDPLHSQPGIVQYGEISPGVADLTAFVATNDGYLHAINTVTGIELWAFIPQEELGLLKTNFENTDGSAKSYGLDGDVAAWIDDKNKDGIINGLDRVILYVGQRRGGNNIYAIDVTNRAAPRFLWKIEGGVPGTAYEELGQTWSTVNVEQVKDNGNSKTVLIFGGGYDTRHDNDDPLVLPRTAPGSVDALARDDSVGRTVFIADALTGSVIWSAGKGGVAPTNAMDYAIPARVKPLDLSGDGNIDRLYVADLGGQIFRFDFDETLLETASFSASAITGGIIADLSKDDSLEDARRFYYPPDVALVAERGKPLYLGLAISSGYRAHPNNVDIHDRIFLIKDTDVFNAPANFNSPITDGDLFNATQNTASLPDNATAVQTEASNLVLKEISNKKGWYIDLDDEAVVNSKFIGEKGLAEPLIIEGSVIVTTFVPNTGAAINSCAPQEGNGNVFFLDIIDGTGSYPTDSDSRADRKRGLKKGGIPASPNIIITSDAEPTVCIGTECESLGGSVGLRKTFWYEVEK